MTSTRSRIALVAAVSILSAGCASEGNLLGSSLTTSSVAPVADATKTAAPRVDPACVALTARIDGLRKEGFVQGVEKASAGKSSSVTVKRASLAKMTELEKANAEFQAKCSTLVPPQQTAAVTAGTPAAGIAKPVANTAAAAVAPVAAAPAAKTAPAKP